MTAPIPPMPVGRQRSPLSPYQERIFREWYADRARMSGIDPDPDSPLHKYDYRGAFLSGAEPQIDAGDSLYHWPSQFKDDDHPNRFVKGVGDSKALDSGAPPDITNPAIFRSIPSTFTPPPKRGLLDFLNSARP